MIEHSMENAVKMKRQAYTDDMTGLYNKNCLLEMIENKTLQNEQITVIYWDVNRLKYVNDHFGHIAGDILIKKVGQDCEYPVSAAVGTVTGSGAELEKLISQADRQMYANKMVHRE